MSGGLPLPGRIACAVLCAALALTLGALPALALWSASATVSVQIASAPPEPVSAPPVFRAGKSKATIVNGTGPFEPIAHIDGDRVWLDFGVLAQGNSDNSPEVLLIDNPGEVPYALSASLTAEIRSAFPAISLTPAALFPGGTSTLGMKLDTHGLAVGSYEGTLTVCDLYGTFSEDIPVHFDVVATGAASDAPAQAQPPAVEPAPPLEPGPVVPEVETAPQPVPSAETTGAAGELLPPAPEPPPVTPAGQITCVSCAPRALVAWSCAAGVPPPCRASG